MGVDFGEQTMIEKFLQAASVLARRKVSFELDLVPLHFTDLSLKKVTNWVLTESSVVFKPTKPWGFPTVLQIEPTSRCNLRCKICPVATGLGRPVGDMDPAMFERTVDELADYLLLLMFWDWGEPFLHSNAYRMIRYAHDRGVKVASSTNGHIFASADHARQVIESGLDVLVFSVDGITQETYERCRTSGRLDTVLEGIRNVVAEKRRLRSATPIVNLRFIVMKHGEHEVPQLEEYARSLGVDVLTLRKFHFVPGTEVEDVGQRAGTAPQKADGLVPEEVKFQLPALPEDGQRPVRIDRNPCRNLWNCPTIHWDGTVCSCFMDYNERRPLGSLKQKSFREIWRGDDYTKLRRGFRKHWQELPLCGECASGFAGGDVGREANAEAFFFNDKSD